MRRIFTLGVLIFWISIISQEYRQNRNELDAFFSWRTLSIDPKRVKTKAILTTLNQLMPDFDAFVKIRQNSSVPEETVRPYFNYYRKITHYFPTAAEAWGFLGYCYFLKGESNQAKLAYAKAAELNPEVFWFHYNLGVINFKSGLYKDAASAFIKAIRCDPRKTLLLMRFSKIYQDIMGTTSGENYVLEKDLKQAYLDCRRGIMLSYFQDKEYREVIKVVEKAGDLSSEDQDFFYYAGLAAYNLNDFNQAAHFWYAYLKTHPKDPQTLFYLSEALRKLGKEKEAVFLSEEAVALSQQGRAFLPPARENLFLKMF